VIETLRPGGARRRFTHQEHGGYLQSREAIPEPHAFTAVLRAGGVEHSIVFTEHEHPRAQGGAAHRDNNMRAAVIHVMADAAVSVLVIIGLLLARALHWLWMDPLAGIVGACVIASWSYGLIRDTGAILLDMCPDRGLEQGIRSSVEAAGDDVRDLHLWRVGPGHLSAIVSVVTGQQRGPDFYRERLARFPALSHVTIEVQRS
jgi:cation diffusion facilitator family transporter